MPQQGLRRGDRFLMDFHEDCLSDARKIHPEVFTTTEFEICSVGVLKYGSSNSIVRFVVLRTRQWPLKTVDDTFSATFLMDAFPVTSSTVCTVFFCQCCTKS